MAYVSANSVRRSEQLEALVYTRDRELQMRCTQAFAGLAVRWAMLCNPALVTGLLANKRFNFVILDVDAAEGRSVLGTLLAGNAELQSVVLAVSSRSVDAGLLQTCYRAQVYYPVRPRDLEDAVVHALPFASNFHTCGDSRPRVEDFPKVKPNPRRVFNDAYIDLAAIPFALQRCGTAALSFVKDVVLMKHTFSIRAHERAASLLSAAGVAWYVQDVTAAFTAIENIDPPAQGPTYLIALSLLLWLCAKSRRVAKGRTVAETTCGF